MSRRATCLPIARACAAAIFLFASPGIGQDAVPLHLPTPTEPIVMRLDFNGAPGCSDPDVFRMALVSRVFDWRPLADDGPWRLVVTVTRRGSGYEGSEDLYDPQGKRAWTRASGPLATCKRVLDRLALSLAIQIGMDEPPKRVCKAPPPQPASPAPVPPCEDLPGPLEMPLPTPVVRVVQDEPRTRLSFRFGAAAWTGLVTTDRGAFGLTLDAGLRYGVFSVSAEWRGDPPLGATSVHQFGNMNYGRITGALLPCAHYKWFVGCAKGELGSILFLGNPHAGPALKYGAVGLRLGLDFPAVLPRLFVRVAGEVLEAVEPPFIVWMNTSVFQVARTNAGLGLGILFALDKP